MKEEEEAVKKANFSGKGPLKLFLGVQHLFVFRDKAFVCRS